MRLTMADGNVALQKGDSVLHIVLTVPPHTQRVCVLLTHLYVLLLCY